MTVFTAQFNGVAITNASGTQDLFELVPDATTRIRLLEIELNQASDFGDAQAEIRTLLIMRGHTTTGSGGGAVTPVNLDPYGRASVTTVARNNTTLATAGSPETIIASGWHLQAGFIWRPPEVSIPGVKLFRRFILVKPSQRIVIRLAEAVTDDLADVSGTVTFEEIGKSPVS